MSETWFFLSNQAFKILDYLSEKYNLDQDDVIEMVLRERADQEQWFPPMTQIKYTPTHAEGVPDHPDIEYGFVTSVKGDTIFCRYWSKHNPDDLRTTANSEGTPIGMLSHYVSKAPVEIFNIIKKHHVQVRGRYDGENWIMDEGE